MCIQWNAAVYRKLLIVYDNGQQYTNKVYHKKQFSSSLFGKVMYDMKMKIGNCSSGTAVTDSIAVGFDAESRLSENDATRRVITSDVIKAKYSPMHCRTAASDCDFLHCDIVFVHGKIGICRLCHRCGLAEGCKLIEGQ